MRTSYAKRVSKIRSKTVEPVLGTLINFTNMRRVNGRGIQIANKHILMAALTYNLKKYMKWNGQKSIVKVMELRPWNNVQNSAKKALGSLLTQFNLLMYAVLIYTYPSSHAAK